MKKLPSKSIPPPVKGCTSACEGKVPSKKLEKRYQKMLTYMERMLFMYNNVF